MGQRPQPADLVLDREADHLEGRYRPAGHRVFMVEAGSRYRHPFDRFRK